MQLFVGVVGVCGARYFGMKKGLRNSEGLYIHDGGDEGDRTPDLLTASQALSRLVRLHTPLNRVKRALQYAGNPKTHPECLSL